MTAPARAGRGRPPRAGHPFTGEDPAPIRRTGEETSDTRAGRRHRPSRATLALYGISCGGMTVSTCNAAERKSGVFEAGDIREWRGHDVVDSDGHKIGELEAIYRRHEHRPASIRHRHGRDAYPAPARVRSPGSGDRGSRIPQGRSRQKTSEGFSLDRHRRRAASGREEAIFKHYGLTYQPGTSGERQLARR